MGETLTYLNNIGTLIGRALPSVNNRRTSIGETLPFGGIHIHNSRFTTFPLDSLLLQKLVLYQ